MMCKICELVQGTKSARIVYQDDFIIAELVENAPWIGALNIYPKEHIPSLEQLSDDARKHLFLCASLGATAVFEALGAQGTNILLKDGKAAGSEHLVVQVFPRMQDDGVNLQWSPKEMNEGKLKEIREKISNETFMVGKVSKPKKPTISDLPSAHFPVKEYYIHQLRRLP